MFPSTFFYKLIFPLFCRSPRFIPVVKDKRAHVTNSVLLVGLGARADSYSTVVGDYINTMKTVLFKFLFLTSLFRLHYKFTSNQREAFIIDSFSFIMFYVYVYPCCSTAWYKSKLKTKVVFYKKQHSKTY